MRTVSAALQAHLESELTTLAYLVKISRLDGTVMGFTTHDRDLTVGGVAYKACGAFTPSMIESASSLATDNLEISGILDSADITESDIAHGLYDHARVDMHACNWADLTQGTVQLRRGWLGEVTRFGTGYAAELRGLHDMLQRPIGAYYTAECRYDLGDSSCTVNLAALTVTGTVSGVIDRANFTDTSRGEASDTFNYGKLTWLTGANAGAAMEVKTWDANGQQFTLWLPMPNNIAAGDTYSVYPGCDKRLSTCQGTYNNVTNFGGFPYVPGVGNILQYPDSK